MTPPTPPKAERKLLGAVALVSCGLVVGLGLAGAAYLYGAAPGPLAPAVAQEAPVPQEAQVDEDVPVAEGDTPFHAHIAQAGISACDAVFPLMGALITQGSDYVVQTRWNADAPGGHPIQALVGMAFETPQYTGPALGYVFAAPIGDACAGGMLRVTPFEENCDMVATSLISAGVLDAQLQDLRSYLMPDGSQVVVMPAGEACIAISVGEAP